MYAKNLKYFLLGVTPTGRIKCSFGNWTGVAYKIPRAKLVCCKNIDYLSKAEFIFFFAMVRVINLLFTEAFASRQASCFVLYFRPYGLEE